MAEWGELKDTPEGGGQPTRQVNCFHCVHFKITWDPKHPKACLFFGFSGPEMPSETVRKTTGRNCPAFKPKRKPENTP